MEWFKPPEANCRGVSPDLFFPTRGESTKEAMAVCAGCVVREECLEYALEHNERWGVWGMTSERSRRKLRRGLRASGPPGRPRTAA